MAHSLFNINRINIFINRIQILELLNQFARAFRSNTRYAGDIVGRIALNRFDINQLFRRNAVVLHDFRFIVNRHLRLAEFGRGKADAHLGADQLQAVAIPGRNYTFVTGITAFFSKRTKNVVGFKALAFYQTIAQKLQKFLQVRQLLCQLLGHTFTLCLVTRVFLVAERGRAHIKSDCNRVGVRFIFQLLQHGQKTIYSVGKQPLLCGQKANAVERPV